eukprot:1577313-Pleurochrysis_carterae.AAC.2
MNVAESSSVDVGSQPPRKRDGARRRWLSDQSRRTGRVAESPETSQEVVSVLLALAGFVAHKNAGKNEKKRKWASG